VILAYSAIRVPMLCEWTPKAIIVFFFCPFVFVYVFAAYDCVSVLASDKLLRHQLRNNHSQLFMHRPALSGL
jgi:hypothetical protein